MASVMFPLASELVNRGRSDPEYYLPHHTEVDADLLKVTAIPLGQLGRFSCSAFYPAATHLYSDTGIPFLRCVDILNYPILSNDQPYARIPQQFVSDHRSIICLAPGDIIISKVGSPCFASLLSEDMPVSAMTRTVLGMSSIKTEKIDAFYLIAFLRSKHGFDQLMRERELTIQYQLTLDRTRKVRVFLPDMDVQKEIGSIIKKYYTELRLSLENYRSACRLLESAIGLDKLSFIKPKGYATQFSDVINNSRADADYFQVPFRQIHQHLDKCRTVPLFRLMKISKGFEVGSNAYLNSGHLFLRVSNVKEMELRAGASDKYISDALYQNLQEYHPIVGELLLTKDGSPGICFAIDQEIDGIISGGTVRLTPLDKSIPTEYLALVINSMVCRMQVEQDCSGALILHWRPTSIRKLRIPLLSNEVMNDIATLVRTSKQEKRESDRLLEHAKNRVEQLIQTGVHQ